MISMKTNSRGKLPVPPPKFQGPVSAPTPKTADDLSIPAFLDAKKTESAKSPAVKAKGPLSQIAAAIKDGKEPPKTALKTTAKDASGGKAAKIAAVKKAVAEIKTGSSSSYDWEKATAASRAGTVPKLPPFVSYGPHLKKVHGFAVKSDATSIKQLTSKLKKDPCPPGRKNLFRYAELCLSALKVKTAA